MQLRRRCREWFHVAEVEPGVHLVAEPGHVFSWLVGGNELFDHVEMHELGWRIDPPQPTRLLVDGDTVELGGRTLRVIHTPGHAPDHICLLDEAAGILFAQDQAYYGPLLVYEPGTDPATYARSARRLADELVGAIRIVYTAHCLRPSVPPRFLGELADAAEAVAACDVPLAPASGMLGEPVLGADFGYFSILVSREFVP